MFMQQMAPDIFVRILRGMGACRKKPAQPASGTLSWMTPSETLLRLCLGGFGKIFAKQRLLLAFVRFHGPIFETEKPFENVCTTRGLPCMYILSTLHVFQFWCSDLSLGRVDPAPPTQHLQGLFAPSTQNSSLRSLSKVDSVAHPREPE